MPMKTVWVGLAGNKVVAVCDTFAVAERLFRLSYSRRVGTITVENADRNGNVVELTHRDKETGCVERVTFQAFDVLDCPDHL
jgi:hypothetical protein